MQRRIGVCRTHASSSCCGCRGTQPPLAFPKQAVEPGPPRCCVELRLLLVLGSRDCRLCRCHVDVAAGVDLRDNGGAVQATTTWPPLSREHGSAKAAAAAAPRFMSRVCRRRCARAPRHPACGMKLGYKEAFGFAITPRFSASLLLSCLLSSASCALLAMMRRQALTGGGGILSLGVVWSQALCAKVGSRDGLVRAWCIVQKGRYVPSNCSHSTVVCTLLAGVGFLSMHTYDMCTIRYTPVLCVCPYLSIRASNNTGAPPSYFAVSSCTQM